jgi:chromosome segregation ATPase
MTTEEREFSRLRDRVDQMSGKIQVAEALHEQVKDQNEKLDAATVKLTEVSTRLVVYTENQNMLNKSLVEGLKSVGSAVNHLKIGEASTPHKCEEEIKKHEWNSAAHNPKKFLGLLALVSAGIAAAGKILHSILTYSDKTPTH